MPSNGFCRSGELKRENKRNLKKMEKDLEQKTEKLWNGDHADLSNVEKSPGRTFIA